MYRLHELPFVGRDYTVKQRLYMWFLLMLRNACDIISGIVGILSLGFIQLTWGSTVSENILLAMIKFYKERKK
jgi:hypothetical protein